MCSVRREQGILEKDRSRGVELQLCESAGVLESRVRGKTSPTPPIPPLCTEDVTRREVESRWEGTSHRHLRS